VGRDERGEPAGLNRAVLDVAPGELRRQLGYKCGWYGSALVVADRWYPSSKTCSGCGWRKPSLPRSERMFCCGNTACGLVIDRDLNAALNLAALVRASLRYRQ
jgi:putative transposase